jgi:hypothetical protein
MYIDYPLLTLKDNVGKRGRCKLVDGIVSLTNIIFEAVPVVKSFEIFRWKLCDLVKNLPLQDEIKEWICTLDELNPAWMNPYHGHLGIVPEHMKRWVVDRLFYQLSISDLVGMMAVASQADFSEGPLKLAKYEASQKVTTNHWFTVKALLSENARKILGLTNKHMMRVSLKSANSRLLSMVRREEVMTQGRITLSILAAKVGLHPQELSRSMGDADVKALWGFDNSELPDEPKAYITLSEGLWSVIRFVRETPYIRNIALINISIPATPARITMWHNGRQNIITKSGQTKKLRNVITSTEQEYNDEMKRALKPTTGPKKGGERTISEAESMKIEENNRDMINAEIRKEMMELSLFAKQRRVQF